MHGEGTQALAEQYFSLISSPKPLEDRVATQSAFNAQAERAFLSQRSTIYRSTAKGLPSMSADLADYLPEGVQDPDTTGVIAQTIAPPSPTSFMLIHHYHWRSGLVMAMQSPLLYYKP